MADEPIQSHPEPDTQVPPRLAADLSRLFPPAAVPTEIDHAVLRAAQRRFARRRRNRRLVLAAGPLAAAAGLAVAVWLLPRLTASGPTAPAGQSALRGDLNADGRVDIIDALVLAAAIRGGADLNPAWDLTGDSAVSGEDVDAIAAIAVRLPAPASAPDGGAS